MVLSDMLRSLLRRWYIVVLGVILTAAGVYGAYTVTPVTYSATSTVVLLPPEKSVKDGDNPYLYLGGLGQALNVLVITMNSAASQEQVIGSNPDQSFTLEQDATSTGPIIQISVAAPTDDQAIALVEKVTAQVPLALNALQDELKVPADAKIGTMTLAQSREAETENKRQLQLMAVAAGGGSVATVLFVAALDKFLAKRKFKNKRRKSDDKHDGPGSAGMTQPPSEAAARLEVTEARLTAQPVRFANGT